MMPSQRRFKAISLFVIVTIVIIFYMSSAGQQTRSSPFYTKTQQALQDRQYEEAAKQRDADSVGSRLKAAEDQAKKAADDKHAKVKDSVEGDAKSVAGRVKLDGDKVPGVAAQGGKPRDQAAMNEHETPEDHEVEMELNAILRKSPTIVFSKSYCPYSKMAKHILLDKYTIVPEPYVVELDLHPLGPKLQEFLGHMTGRRTVPNVLLMGKSIGGGDDMQELDETDALVEKFKTMGGTRITKVEHREARGEKKASRRRA
ncbi:glutaredoxin domain-containing protein [Dothidotthia symphoricarpi CBS 119687]|uniref:Glutaredoxin domain-containing protein n=1 Tax=Dothidotthia symphoricarpi CBS 119687 TaxID=1392245 RepID=A0A6A6ADN7_9PLEO|nr:glutaredoxin domain-containing protein [Dothidotthia symphoricarpi CBS 119687]KAF2129383.1 glutaredoxin domain-containing protein [Dothidotthia symphoricarpi CBS 119687]